MKYKSIELKTKEGILLALTNLVDNVFDLFDIVEDSDNGNEILPKLQNIINIKNICLDRETDTYIRFKMIGTYMPLSYLIITL